MPRWIRPTRGTLAAINALTKNKPGRLLASIRDAVAANRRVWVEQTDATLRGLCWHDEVQPMINTAIAELGSGSGSTEYLITNPSIAGATTAQPGASVTLTASGGAYLWGGATGITYEWDYNGSLSTGVALAINAAATAGGVVTAKVRAKGTGGTVSDWVTHTLTAVANQAPSATGVTINLPATVTRGSTYTVTISGGSDADGTIATRTLTSPVGCTLSGASASTVNLTVNNDATSVSVTPVVTDNQGLSSVNGLAITRGGAAVVQPTGASGSKASGTHTVTIPAGVSSYTLVRNGGAGTAAVAGTTCSGGTTYHTAGQTGQIFTDGGWNTFTYSTTGCWNDVGLGAGVPTVYMGAASGGSAATAGAATTTSSGGTQIDSAAGAATGVTTAPAATSVVKSKDPATALTLTVVVAANGGTWIANW